MKKYVLTTLILILSFLMFNENAYAIAGVASFDGGRYPINLTWYTKGNGSGNSGSYIDHKKIITINGQKPTAYCLDPGLNLRTGDRYTCTASGDAGLIWLAEQGQTGDYSVVQMAMRFYATYKGLGNDSSMTSMEAAMVRYLQVMDGMDLRPSCPTCSTNAADYLRGNDAIVSAGYALAAQARFMSSSAPSASGELTFTKTAASTKDQIEYRVQSLSDINKVKFVCEGCTIIGADDDFSGKSGRLVVKPAPDCADFKIKAYYIPKGVYLCHATNAAVRNSKQLLVVSFDDTETSGEVSGAIDTSGDPNSLHNDKGIGCKEDCCTEKDIKPNYITGDINNCCLDNTHSWAKEYELNDLVCYSDEFQVNHYWEMCNSENYIDQKMKGELNEYCDIYCTERVTVDIPGAITATSGRYFDLTTTGQGTKSPYIEGYKRCRTLIHFKKWQDDYRKQVEEQVRQYNLYQYNKIYELMYQDAINASQSCSLHIKVECTGQSVHDSDRCDHGSPPNVTHNNCTANASTLSESGVAFDQTKSYTQYKFLGAEHRNKPWHEVKLKEEGFKPSADGYYNYYKMIHDKTDYARHDNDYEYYYVADMIASAHAAKSAKEAIRDSDSNDCCYAEAGVSCTWEFVDSCGNSEGDLTSKTENVQAQHDKYNGAAERAKGAYQAAVVNAKTLEEKIDKCDKYFTDYEGTDANSNFPFSAQFFGFEYSQVYLGDYGDLKRDVSTIPFENSPGCVVTGPILGPDAEDGMVEPQYSSKYYSDKITETEDFGDGGIEWEEFNTGFEKYIDDLYKADQKFVQDAKYKAVCSWNEPPNTKYTLVQNGIVMSGEKNVTKNDRQYHIHLSTLEGTYDTKWLLSGLGSNAKFDRYFAENGEVCSGRQSATTDGLFHCALRVEYEIISTGKCNGSKTTVSTDECDPAKVPETVLNFKIVDPAAVFTCNSTDECGYGYNWFDMPGGPETLSDIRRKGSTLNTYSPENMTYQVTLNSKDMRVIKDYNSYRENNNFGGYSDFGLGCDCPEDGEECNEVGGTQTCKRSESCKMCRSGFLNNLYDGFVNYNGNHSITRGSGNLETIRSSGHVHWAGV